MELLLMLIKRRQVCYASCSSVQLQSSLPYCTPLALTDHMNSINKYHTMGSCRWLWLLQLLTACYFEHLKIYYFKLSELQCSPPIQHHLWEPQSWTVLQVVQEQMWTWRVFIGGNRQQMYDSLNESLFFSVMYWLNMAAFIGKCFL